MSKASTLTSTDYSTLNLTDGQTTDVKESRRDTFPPDTGWAWVVAVASMMNVFLLMSFYRGLGILVVELMEIYEAPTAKVSLIFSCISIGFATSSILFIFGIGDIFHERALVAASAFLTFLGFLVTFFSTRIEHVCVQGVCTGAAIQIGMTCGMSLVGRYFDKRLSVANGIVMSGSSLGVLVSPPVVQWLLNEYSYRGTALICAGLTLNSLACSSLMRPVPRMVKSEIVPVQQDSSRIMSATGCSESQDQSAENNSTKYIIVPEVPPRVGADKNTAIKDFSNVTCFVPDPDMEVVDISSTANTADDRRSARCFETVRLAIKQFSLKDNRDRPANVSVWRSMLPSVSLLKNPALPFLQMFMFFSTAGSECVMQYYPASTRELGMSEYQSAFLLSMAGVGDLLSRVGLGFLGDYNFMARYKLVMIPQFVLGTVCFLPRFATEFWSQAIFAVIIGLTVGTSTAYMGVVLIDFFGLKDFGRLLGISTFVGSTGAASGSQLIGYLRDVTGEYEVPFQITGAFLFAAGLSVLLAGTCRWCQKRKRDQQYVN